MAPPVPEVGVELAVRVRPEVGAVLLCLPLLSQLALLALLAPLAELPVLSPLALLEVVALLEAEAELAVEEVSVEALHRSFSPAMVGNLPSTGTPRYSPVPRSGRKAKRRP